MHNARLSIITMQVRIVEREAHCFHAMWLFQLKIGRNLYGVGRSARVIH